MDLYSSGEDPAIKARKPYTITKQRERWTGEEHNRFLEALKLYGRAWQRIEEHIGTKTAVQIRSHAQKFFTKLKKEAVVKGFPTVGHTLDIEIPPPRPKRKPSNPYPRKTSLGAPTLQVVVEDVKTLNTVSCLSQDKITQDLEKEHEKSFDDGKPGNTDGPDKEGDRCEVFTLLTAAPPLVAPQRKYTSKEYMIPPKETSHEEDKTSVSHVITETKGIQTDKSDKDQFQENSSCNTSNIVDSYPKQEKSVQGKIINELTKSKNVNRFPTTEMQEASENYPLHVPVHTLIGSLGMSTQHISPRDSSSAQSFLHQMNGIYGHQNLFMNPIASANPDHHDNTSKSSPNQSFHNYHPILTQQLSCTFSSLIVSALLRNPAAYAAATFAATLSPILPHSMAAIAAATVAAATAWWASHGLIPSCPPFHPDFNSPMDISQNTAVDNEKREKSLDQLEPNSPSKALPEQLPISKSLVLTLSDFEGSESAKMNSGLATAEESQFVDEPKLTDASKCNNRKKVDRSSCGSNTPSSSEEGDGLENHAHGKEENHIKDKEETKKPEAIYAIGDPFGRRIRSTNNNVNDSWKEVSEEGRLAFRALFSRQVLPQSFSPPHNLVNKEKNNTCNDMVSANEKNEVAPSSSPSLTGLEGLLSMGLNTKLKSRQTGFIPYKRCSMKAKEDTNVSANCQDEEKGPKRLRLEGQALT